MEFVVLVRFDGKGGKVFVLWLRNCGYIFLFMLDGSVMDLSDKLGDPP